MCNLFENRTAFSDLLEAFARVRKPVLKPGPQAAPNLAPLDAVRPTDAAPVLRSHEGGVELARPRWGLASDRPGAGPVTNLRSEGRAFAEGRCLVPVTAFFEFTGSKSPKTRWRFSMAGRPWFCFAAVWRVQAGVGRFALLTVGAGPDMAPYHHRQPVVLGEEAWAAWLDGADAGLPLAPSPARTLRVLRDSPEPAILPLFGDAP